MRPFEILTLVLISGTLVALMTHKDRTVFLYLLLAAIASTILQHFIEGNRWQFAPAVYSLPVLYIVHRFQNDSVNIIIKAVLIIWFGTAVLLPWIIPVFTLPDPGGRYSIGTETFHWTDSSRSEWFTPEDSTDVREIMIQIWYPAKIPDTLQPEPYLDFINLRAETMASAGNIPSFFPGHLEHIITNSYGHVECLENSTGHPVLIFSHGITSSRHLHQVLFEYLASRGYIIAAPDHSFDANLTIFPDKQLADYRSNITGHPDSVNIRKQQMDTRGLDISFIIDQLEKLQNGSIKSTLNGKLDLQKIAVAGHSYGGSTATVAAHKDERIKACAVLDSWISPVPEPIISAGIHVPFLFMGRPTWEGSDYPGNYPRLDSLLAHSSEPKYRMVIKNTLHQDYTDIPLFSPIIEYVMQVGDLSPAISLTLINRLTHGFLDKHLLGRNGKKFDQILMNNLIIRF